jgi:phosphate transport system substrate-binding protein
VALASHGLDIAEVTRQGMQVHEIARVAVVFGVNSTVVQTSLTESQLCDVYAGRVRDWSSFGHAALPLAARTRPDSEVDAEVVRSHVKCLGPLTMPATVTVMSRAGDMAQELAATSGAIGMTTMTVVEQSQGKVRALAINGVAPTPGNVERMAYAMVRQSYFVVKSPASPAVARFIEYARSAAGHTVITANGALPVK